MLCGSLKYQVEEDQLKVKPFPCCTIAKCLEFGHHLQTNDSYVDVSKLMGESGEGCVGKPD